MTPRQSPLDGLLEAVKAVGVPFAFIGAAARNAWAPPRATTDIDLAAIISPDTYDRLVRSMAGAGYSVGRAHPGEPGDPVPAVTIFRNEAVDPPYRQVDVLAAATPFEEEAVSKRIDRLLGDRAIPVIRREHLIVYKLLAWLDRDKLDIADVLATAKVAGAQLDIACIEKWAAEWEVADRWKAALAAGAQA